jgi:hypothetical protein
MDINGIQRLTRREYEQRERSAASIPEYGWLNTASQPGWLLQGAIHSASGLRSIIVYLKRLLPDVPAASQQTSVSYDGKGESLAHPLK